MAPEGHRGVLEASSWHGLEEVGVMADADQMIGKGEAAGAWPVGLRFDSLLTAGGLKAPGRGVVAQYAKHPEQCISVVGDRYRAPTPDEWRMLVRAATAAGARPTGAFSLRDGTRVLATFEVGLSNGIRTQLLFADAFDGSMRLITGTTSVRVVCANTFSAALSSDGEGMAKLLHTASLEQKVNVLAESIGKSIATGEKVRKTYHEAEQLGMSKPDAMKVFDLLFPEAPADAPAGTKTRAENEREAARKAMWLPVNNAGSSLATLWNAATYLVDRNVDGSPKATRSDRLDSMLFGARGERVQEIQTIVEVVMRDGSIVPMTVSKALDAGVDPKIVGSKILDEMLADA
jgi:hypothetical protein